MSKADPLSGALTKSLRDEDAAVDRRFARADAVLGEGQGRKHAPRHSKPAPRKKVVREQFSFSETDYALLPEIQRRCLEGRHSATKSEIVRAGLNALAQMKPKELLAVVKGVEKLKPGPPKGSS